jgi:hypothetical protein
MRPLSCAGSRSAGIPRDSLRQRRSIGPGRWAERAATSNWPRRGSVLLLEGKGYTSRAHAGLPLRAGQGDVKLLVREFRDDHGRLVFWRYVKMERDGGEA